MWVLATATRATGTAIRRVRIMCVAFEADSELALGIYWFEGRLDVKNHFWKDISREERFFTSVLHHEILKDDKPLSNILCKLLNLDSGVEIKEVGFEVCFFRDGAKDEFSIIERQNANDNRKALEKQTFDFMVFFSDESAAIIEAKVQQGFDTEQIEALIKSKKIIENSKKKPIKKMYIVALCSSMYKPKNATLEKFSAKITWEELKVIYPSNKDIFERANSIYGQ